MQFIAISNLAECLVCPFLCTRIMDTGKFAREISRGNVKFETVYLIILLKIISNRERVAWSGKECYNNTKQRGVKKHVFSWELYICCRVCWLN